MLDRVKDGGLYGHRRTSYSIYSLLGHQLVQVSDIQIYMERKTVIQNED